MRVQTRITAITAAKPISAAEFRTYAKAVNISGEDSLIDTQLAASVRYIENYIGKSINTNTFETTVWSFDDVRDIPNGELIYEAVNGPLSSVTSVKGYDLEGSETALVSGTDYYTLQGGRVRIPSATTYDSYKITYICGMEEVEVTDNIKEAILKITAELYQNRGISVTGTIVSNLKTDLSQLLNAERTKLFF